MDEWPEDLKIVEAIDVTKDDDEIYCMIGFCSADAKFVFELWRKQREELKPEINS